MENAQMMAPILELDGMEVANKEELTAKDAESFRKQEFTPEELKQIDEFSEKINLHDTNTIITYGAGSQKRLSEFSDAIMEQMQTKELGEIGDSLSSLIADLKVNPDEKKGLGGFFKKQENKAEKMKAHYSKVETNIDGVIAVLEKHQETLTKDITMLDELFEKNKVYFKELTMYIAAGKMALEKARTEELAALQKKAEETGLAEDAQEASDFANMCERFEKKLYDLELTRNICLQNAPQIRLVQNNAILMTDKIQTAIVNTIPLWKNQMVITLGLAHSQEAIKAQNMVNNATNDLLKKNAELLHQTSIDTAKENERGIVDLETLQETNSKLISTFDEIMKIQEEGRNKRIAAEAELSRIENELNAKLLEVSRNK